METRRSRRRHCAWFPEQLRGFGYEARNEWPFNTSSQGYFSVCQYRRVLSAGHVTLARITVANGDVPQAPQLLAELEYLGHHRHAARAVASAKLERARLLVMQGDLPAAWEETGQANAPEIWQHCKAQRLPANEADYLEVGLARWLIAAGQCSEAMPAIEKAIVLADSQHCLRRAMKLAALRSLALEGTGDVAAATVQMRDVLKTAARKASCTSCWTKAGGPPR